MQPLDVGGLQLHSKGEAMQQQRPLGGGGLQLHPADVGPCSSSSHLLVVSCSSTLLVGPCSSSSSSSHLMVVGCSSTLLAGMGETSLV
eukprot:361440-Chlamydomonas_euryale.AAC.1